jgi:hypothetical protein
MTRQHRAPPARRPARLVIALAAALAMILALVIIKLDGGFGGGQGDPPARAYVGVFAPPAPASYAGVTAFTAATGVRPGLVAYYSAWNEPFRAGFAAQAARHHALPLVQIDPAGISLAAIARGHYDAYLRTYARAVRASGRRLVLSFGHEMNGTWYSWGYPHVSPTVWVAAWRHVVTLFRNVGASNVTWLWAPNVTEPGAPSLSAYWPGARYVTWVGLDGYLANPADTFSNVFGPSIAAIRRITEQPLLIAETAVGPMAGQVAKIPGLFAGMRQDRLLGIVWFDVAQQGGIYRQDWRLEDNPAALAEFRAEVRQYW